MEILRGPINTSSSLKDAICNPLLMSSASRLSKVVQYTTVAATTVGEIADNSNVPFLETAVTGITALLNMVQVCLCFTLNTEQEFMVHLGVLCPIK